VLQEPCIRGPSTSRETPPLSSPHGARNRALNNETLQNLDEVTSNLIICFEAERPPYLQHPAVLGETGLPEEEVAGPCSHLRIELPAPALRREGASLTPVAG
jgi:hypothetical protein